MADKFSAGLTDQDEMSMFPSAASPLTALGIDPDMARANPELLSTLNPTRPVASQPKAVPSVPGGVKMPGDEQEPAPDESAKVAGTVGGAGVAPATAPTTAPSNASDYQASGLRGVLSNADMASQADQQIPTSSPDIDRLTALRGKLAPAPQLYDPSTGKMLASTQEYDPTTGKMVTIAPKPSVGRRIWRGVRGGLIGLAEGGLPGALVGAIDPKAIGGGEAYGAPDDAYQKAEAQRQGELASTNTSLDQARLNLKNAQDAIKARAEGARSNAGEYDKLITGTTGIQNAATSAAKIPIDQENADTAKQTAQNNAPEAKLSLNQKEYDQRASRVATMNLSPLNKTLYMLNGKIPDPQQPNEAEITAGAAARALTVYKLQHGGQDPQTLEDFNSIQSAARGMMDRGSSKLGSDDEISAIVADADAKKQAYASTAKRMPSGSYLTDKGMLTPQKFKDALDKFRVDANVKLSKKGAQIDAQGNIVRSGNSSGAPQKTISAPPPGATGQAKGSDGRMHWVNETTRQVLGPV